MSRLRPYHLYAALLAFACVSGAPSAGRLPEGEGCSDYARAGQEYTAVRMGVAVRLVLHADDPQLAATAARAAFERMSALEAILSDYQPQSELRTLMRNPGVWVPASGVLFEVLERSVEVARLTDGAFDPTVGPLVALWRRARDSGDGWVASQAELDSARARVGWWKVELDSATGSVRIEPGVMLDLGGVAKGYILAEVAGVLRELGVRRFLVEAGGDIVVGEPPPGRSGWSIAVRGADSAFAQRAGSLVNAALSTSGGSVQYVEVAVQRYSHVINPTVGTGAAHGDTWHVIHPDAATADALATALSASGGRDAGGVIARFPGALAARVSAPRQAGGWGTSGR